MGGKMTILPPIIKTDSKPLKIKSHRLRFMLRHPIKYYIDKNTNWYF